MNDYEAKQKARRERYEARAAKARIEAKNRFNSPNIAAVRDMGGEPIKIGHHSERSHRAIYRRADNDMRKGCEALDKAKHYDHKAEGVGLGGISSDDPDALPQLKDKLAALEAEQRQRKAVNAAWRKHGKPAPEITDDTTAQWVAITAAANVHYFGAYFAEILRGMVQQWAWNPRKPWPPFQTYELTNKTANIRSVKKRIASLEASQGAEHKETTGNGYRVAEDPDDNRIRIYFDDRPSREVCKLLRTFGWRWSRANMAWQRRLNNASWASADYILARIAEIA